MIRHRGCIGPESGPASVGSHWSKGEGARNAEAACARAGLVDEMHVVVVPILLGSGERLFDHLDGGPHGYRCVEFAGSPSVAHTRFARAS